MIVTQTSPRRADVPADVRPWPALAALCIGFFMILVDMTIVTVATPDIIVELDATQNAVLWVTSAYLLAYAVPVLISGRLGDRFGPKWLYLIGPGGLHRGLAVVRPERSIEMLIAARVLQGVGAAMITPQTMAVITRIFPAERRGQAMAAVGRDRRCRDPGRTDPRRRPRRRPRLGVDLLHQRADRRRRALPQLAPGAGPLDQRAPFDWLGVALSGAGMFALVFGIQNGEQHDWDVLVWALIGSGLALMALFVGWQARNRQEPLVPLGMFADRNFSVSNLGISCMGFAAVAMGFPLMLYAQLVRGLSALEASLLMVPMAVVSLVMAPIVGQFTDRVHPRS